MDTNSVDHKRIITWLGCVTDRYFYKQISISVCIGCLRCARESRQSWVINVFQCSLPLRLLLLLPPPLPPCLLLHGPHVQSAIHVTAHSCITYVHAQCELRSHVDVQTFDCLWSNTEKINILSQLFHDWIIFSLRLSHFCSYPRHFARRVILHVSLPPYILYHSSHYLRINFSANFCLEWFKKLIIQILIS